MYVKVCGLSEIAQIDKAVEFGYDAIGVVAYPKSRRFCPPEKAVELAQHAKGKIDTFLVGMTYEDVKQSAHAFDYVQIFEPKPLPNLVFASKKKPPQGLDFIYFLYDASAGHGLFSAFPQWLTEMQAKVIVAGGLDSENVCEVIRTIRPFGVDISSGVEKEGVKDFDLMAKFIQTVRRCA